MALKDGCSPTEPVGLARGRDGLLSKEQMKQPNTDSATYRSLTLEQNGLAVLLCSDARAEKAAAAMNVRRASACASYLSSQASLSVNASSRGGSLITQALCLRLLGATQGFAPEERGRFGAQVRVGSLCDPQALPGLAHFTEHMLFYASAKYPDEDAYSKFLVRHSVANLHISCLIILLRLLSASLPVH